MRPRPLEPFWQACAITPQGASGQRIKYAKLSAARALAPVFFWRLGKAQETAALAAARRFESPLRTFVARFRGAFGPGCWSGAARCGHRRRRRRTGGALTTPSEPKLSHRNALRARRAAVAFSRPVLGFWSDRFFNAANF